MWAMYRRPSPAFRKMGKLWRRFALRLEELEPRNLLSTAYVPSAIQTAYAFNQISFNGVRGDGSGQTIAIVDAYSHPGIASDLQYFSSYFGLPSPHLTTVNQAGGMQLPSADAGWASEIALDVEWSHALAPRANLLLVSANSSNISDLMAAVDYAAANASVVSMSWGGSEFADETTSAYDGVFRSHPSTVFIAAAGDSGAQPTWPAVSPSVLGVGGTSLLVSPGGSYGGETAWSQSGGGVSQFEPQPSYQSGVALSQGQRSSPDVSFNANPGTGYFVFDSYNGGWQVDGGTSAGAPQWAALVAIANQGRTLQGQSSLEAQQLLSAVYSLPSSDFHDVTVGSNGNPATPGYDTATGRGTPVASKLVSDLVAVNAQGQLPTTTKAVTVTITSAATTTTGSSGTTGSGSKGARRANSGSGATLVAPPALTVFSPFLNNANLAIAPATITNLNYLPAPFAANLGLPRLTAAGSGAGDSRIVSGNDSAAPSTGNSGDGSNDSFWNFWAPAAQPNGSADAAQPNSNGLPVVPDSAMPDRTAPSDSGSSWDGACDAYFSMADVSGGDFSAAEDAGGQEE